MSEDLSQYNVFLSHSHAEAEWVESLARRLVDERGFSVWLDRWILVPGTSWQQEMARGLDQARTCAVCIGRDTPAGWFREEIERSLDIQTRNPEFRVIPVLLPEASADSIPEFLTLKTWADFRNGQNEDYAFHVLVQGIRGEPIGRWEAEANPQNNQTLAIYEQKLKELQRLREFVTHDEVVIEIERRILNLWFDDRG
jgi:hypothetical protein